MSAIHHKYYPIEVLEKELIQLEKIYTSWSHQAQCDFPDKYKELSKKIAQLKNAITNLDQILKY